MADEEAPILYPDPNGDRECNHRWEHRDSTSNLQYAGETWCSLCYAIDAEGIRLVEDLPTS